MPGRIIAHKATEPAMKNAYAGGAAAKETGASRAAASEIARPASA